MIRTSAVSRRHKFIRQIVLRRWLDASAARHGVTITPAEIAREVEVRRAEAKNNPKYQGVPFEQILKAQGTSLEGMRKSPVLRAQLQERKLSEVLLPEAEMKRRLAEEREAVMRRHGPRRKLAVLLTEVEKGDTEAARQASEQIRGRILREIPFAEAARTYSDDPYTKVAGGDAGWHNRDGSRLPDALLEPAFAAEAGWVSEPIKTEYGYYLIHVVAVEQEPTEAMVMIRMRQTFVNEERQRMLDTAEIQFFDDA